MANGKIGQIEANLDFDMLGSPNFVRFVYDGDLSDSEPPPSGAPAGSAQIEDMYLRYFRSKSMPTEPTAFDGRSDYGPFIENGVPAGGIFTGAEGIKTPAEEAIYGGIAGLQYDPCYHLACDTFSNVSRKAINQMSDAATILDLDARALQQPDHAVPGLDGEGEQGEGQQGQGQRGEGDRPSLSRSVPGPLAIAEPTP